MLTWFVVQMPGEEIEIIGEQLPSVGFVACYKEAVRLRGGRVLAVVRPKKLNGRGHSAPDVIRHM